MRPCSAWCRCLGWLAHRCGGWIEPDRSRKAKQSVRSSERVVLVCRGLTRLFLCRFDARSAHSPLLPLPLDDFSKRDHALRRIRPIHSRSNTRGTACRPLGMGANTIASLARSSQPDSLHDPSSQIVTMQSESILCQPLPLGPHSIPPCLYRHDRKVTAHSPTALRQSATAGAKPRRWLGTSNSV